MYTVLTIIIILICIALGFIVLIQKPKGGGLSSTFGGASNQLFGFQKTTNMVEKWTWGLAIALLVVSLASSAFINPAGPAQTVTPGFTPVTSPADAPFTPTPAPSGAGGIAPIPDATPSASPVDGTEE